MLVQQLNERPYLSLSACARAVPSPFFYFPSTLLGGCRRGCPVTIKVPSFAVA